jgi:hypothetical protein
MTIPSELALYWQLTMEAQEKDMSVKEYTRKFGLITYILFQANDKEIEKIWEVL